MFYQFLANEYSAQHNSHPQQQHLFLTHNNNVSPRTPSTQTPTLTMVPNVNNLTTTNTIITQNHHRPHQHINLQENTHDRYTTPSPTNQCDESMCVEKSGSSTNQPDGTFIFSCFN